MNNRTASLSDLQLLTGRHLRKYWVKSLLLVILSFFAAALTSLQPILLAPALDASTFSSAKPAANISQMTLNNAGSSILTWLNISSPIDPLSLIFIVVVLFVIVGVFAALIEFLAHMLSSWIGANSYCDLQGDLYRHVLSLDMSFFFKNKVGELTSRFVNDVGETSTAIDLSLRQAFDSLLQALIYGGMLFRTSKSLALMVIFVCFLHYFINRFLKKYVQKTTAERSDKLADTGSMLSESFYNIKVIKSFSAEKKAEATFTNFLGNLREASMRFSFFKHIESPLRKILDSFALGIILILAFKSMQSGELSTSGFLLFMLIVKQTIAPISLFAQSFTRLIGGLGSARRILELFENHSQQKEGRNKVVSFNVSIDFKNVCFEYNSSQTVLKDINFSLYKGEVLAVVGLSGAGKSTLADLLVRLYDPIAGSIKIDGVPVDHYTIKSYRKLFGVVPQESLLNHLSIAENIAFGSKQISQSKIDYAAEVANCKDFVNRLPQKFNTLIGDRGVRLSGGQRQRISIARAVYLNPFILILDEATSSLDSESERSVQRSIDKLTKKTTAFIIAHRLSTIMHADRILVLNNQTIEAIGTHDELIKNSPTYSKLFKLQFRSPSRIKTQ